MKRLSIKMRIAIWFTLLMLVISACVYAFMLSVSDSVVETETLTGLMAVVDKNMYNAHMEWDEVEVHDDFTAFTNGAYISIYDEDGQQLYGMLPDGFDQTPEFADRQSQTIEIGNQVYYVYDRQVVQRGRWVKNATSLWFRGIARADGSAGTVHTVIRIILAALPVLVLLAAVGGYLVARQAVKPVEKMIVQAEKISGGSDLSRRLNIDGAEELRRLADTYNAMFDRLENSFKSEKQFTADASHELRTPTTVILAECDYALCSAKSVEEYQESMEVIQRQGTKMSQLIQRMLTFTRLEQGTERVSRDVSDLSELVDVVCREQGENSRGITLSSDITPGINAYIDVMLMTRLLDNLISNAVKYGRENGHIKVGLKKDKDEILLTVSDDGIGISEKELPNIFNRFYQAEKSGEGRQGVGLGLAMVKQIAELHGGTVSAESVKGQGSTFTFTMPTL